MELIEKGFGLALLMLSLIFIRPVIGIFYYRLAWSVLLIFFGVLSGAFSAVTEGSWRSKLGKTLGVFALFIAAALIFFGFAEKSRYEAEGESSAYRIEKTEPSIAGWLTSDDEGLRQAAMTGRPILVDFFAEWCAACHELDEKTWTDSSVRTLMDKYVLVKLDLTKSSRQVVEWQKKYAIVGMPTVILLDSSGAEKHRFEGYKPPDEVRPLLESLL